MQPRFGEVALLELCYDNDEVISKNRLKGQLELKKAVMYASRYATVRPRCYLRSNQLISKHALS